MISRETAVSFGSPLTFIFPPLRAVFQAASNLFLSNREANKRSMPMSITLNSSSEIPWWKEPSKEQWKAWIAAWLGWTLDAFDFTIFLLSGRPHHDATYCAGRIQIAVSSM